MDNLTVPELSATSRFHDTVFDIISDHDSSKPNTRIHDVWTSLKSILKVKAKPGHGVVDSGCSKTMMGETQAKAWLQMLKQQFNTGVLQRNVRRIFRGVGGKLPQGISCPSQ